MTPPRASTLGLWLLLATIGTAVRADDWPEFRGPTGQGHAADVGVALEWSERTNITWKTPVPGRGWSSPVIGDGRLWITTAVDGDDGATSLRLLAFDVESGREVINVEVFGTDETSAPNPKNSLASPTPVIDPDGERVYVHFGASGTAAVTTRGDVLWRIRFPYDSQHGNGGSPVLYGDRLILNIDGYDTAFVVAVDAATGAERWRATRDEPISQAYSTPLRIRVDDTDQIVSVGAFRTTAHDPESGREIWRVGYPNGFSNVPRPVFGHGLVYLSTGFNTPTLLAVRADGEGDVTRSHVAWRLRRGAPLTPSPLLVDGELYVLSDFGIATCVDALTGEIHWQARIGGNHSASPVFADGRIYFQNEVGVTTVIAPGPEFQELAKNELDGSMLASMAVADGSIFIRTDTHLYRIDAPR